MVTSFIIPDRLPPSQRRPQLLLHPTIPEPLHGTNPRTILGDKWWDTIRKAAYEKYDNHCWACGYHASANTVRQTLDAHESYSIDYRRGKMVFVEAVALCYFCHAFIHSGRTMALLEEGRITKAVFNLVAKHGKAILKEANLHTPPPYRGPNVAWGRWRLVIDGTEYPPVYQSREAWLAAYQGGE